uniref:DNA polymerase epsilon subunit 3 n=1 Tax=Phallusia mammillata TaxID=59560 RepID=A0A6F9D7T5_9ASCI|nr:CBF-2 transcription factor CBF/NF-Y/archaeal histone -2 [Phallusia mammillata]
MAEKPEDLNLPTSVITRIIKEALPDGVIMSKESRAAISKAASVFVLYCTSCANNFAMQQKRKTLKDVDVYAALEDMEFENFIPLLKEQVENFKREQKGKKVASEKRKKAKEANANSPTDGSPNKPETDVEMKSIDEVDTSAHDSIVIDD